jgi:hypothetical protein
MHESQARASALLRPSLLYWACVFSLLLAAKLCHVHILWAEEGYGSAGAVQILHGKILYRDFWFDKPPLAALLYVLWHGAPGFGLRLAGAIYALACSFAAFRLARHLWSDKEAYGAASLLTFFLLFDHPATVMTLAPDLLLILPALVAVDCAVRGKAFAAGLCCSVGLAVNAKALLLIPVCLVWCWPAWLLLLAGVATGSAPWFLWLGVVNAWPDYYQQVWWFGAQYSRDTFVGHPWREGLLRTLNWTGFHSALVAGALVAGALAKPLGGGSGLYPSQRCYRTGFVIWLLAGTACFVAGERFFPRYYLFLLPPLVFVAARGFSTATKQWRMLIVALLLIPFLRFGPRYALLAVDLVERRPPHWTDVALNRDSQQAAAMINRAKSPGDTLLVWGYRPDLFAYSQLASASRFLDSQLLTGVIADRHLGSTHVSFPDLAARNRATLTRTNPTWIVDGLGPLNPELALTQYPELHGWLTNYERWGQTSACIIYRRKRQ